MHNCQLRRECIELACTQNVCILDCIELYIFTLYSTLMIFFIPPPPLYCSALNAKYISLFCIWCSSGLCIVVHCHEKYAFTLHYSALHRNAAIWFLHLNLPLTHWSVHRIKFSAFDLCIDIKWKMQCSAMHSNAAIWFLHLLLPLTHWSVHRIAFSAFDLCIDIKWKMQCSAMHSNAAI